MPYQPVRTDEMLRQRPALAHRLEGSSGRYRLTSIEVPVVTTGTVATELRCTACDKPVGCVIESSPARRRRLRRWRLSLVGALVLAVSVTITVSLLMDPHKLARAFVFGLMVAVLGGWPIVTLDSLDYEIYEKVRLRRPRGAHSLRDARQMTQDEDGNWRQKIGDVYAGFQDCNAEPLIGPL